MSPHAAAHRREVEAEAKDTIARLAKVERDQHTLRDQTFADFRGAVTSRPLVDIRSARPGDKVVVELVVGNPSVIPGEWGASSLNVATVDGQTCSVPHKAVLAVTPVIKPLVDGQRVVLKTGVTVTVMGERRRCEMVGWEYCTWSQRGGFMSYIAETLEGIDRNRYIPMPSVANEIAPPQSARPATAPRWPV